MEKQTLANFLGGKQSLKMMSYTYSIIKDENDFPCLYLNHPFNLLETFHDVKAGKCMDLLEFKDCLVVHFQFKLFFYKEHSNIELFGTLDIEEAEFLMGSRTHRMIRFDSKSGKTFTVTWRGFKIKL